MTREITVNGEATQVAEVAGTVADLLGHRLGASDPAWVAVAVNDSVVPRSAWPDRPLHAGDVVEIVTAVQGG